MEKITKKYILNNTNVVRSLVCERMCFVNHSDLPYSVSEHICRTCPFMSFINDLVFELIECPIFCSDDEKIDVSLFNLDGSDFGRF